MNKIKLSPRLLIGLLIALFFGVALYLRVVLPHDVIFSGEWIKLSSIDAYWQMRIVDNLAHNFPNMLTFDPYIIYPDGGHIGTVHFMNWLLAGITWVIGLGSPTQHTIDIVGVYFPAVVGSLTVIPVYFIGKELFGRWAGVIAAGILSITAGEFLGRSLLGFTDTPAAEIFITSVFIMFFIMAVKSAKQKQITYGHIKRREWAVFTKPLVFSFLAGIFLGIYFLTWTGALLFVFILAVYFVVQFIIDHLRGQSSDYLVIVSTDLFLVTIIIFVLFQHGVLQFSSLIIALLIPLILWGVSRLVERRGLKPIFYPLALVVIGLVGLGIFYAVFPSLLKLMMSQFIIFSPTGPGTTTLEMQPLTIALGWGNFSFNFFFSFIALFILIYLVVKRGNTEISLLVVWSLVILIAALGQRRFAYYFAVNVALLTGYLSWQVLWHAGLKHLVARPETEAEKTKGDSATVVSKQKKKREPQLTMRYVNTALATIVIFLLVFFPNIRPAVAVASQARFAPSDAWHSALYWMKDNTPEPFADTDFYYKRYQSPTPGKGYEYPESAYGVTAWWDYGYWITRMAHRLPSANPGQSPEPIINVANLFLSQEEAPSREIMQKLDSSYIIIDYSTSAVITYERILTKEGIRYSPILFGKFHAVIRWAGREQTDFFDIYHLPQEGKLEPRLLFYPEYYRSLVVRLYNFDGEAVTPQNTTVISYEEKVTEEGIPYRQITSAQQFTDYQEALEYVESQKATNYRIVSDSPFVSPVPLEALRNYKVVFSSDITKMEPSVGEVPEVKIFEYIGD